jgi:ribosomal protein S18 acetylase RimI-like enzyme
VHHARAVPPVTKHGVRLRPETIEDEPLLFALYASTREEELALTGWDAETRAGFVRMQFNAQRTAYREMFPGGEFSIVLAAAVPIGRIVVNRARDEIRLVDLVIEPARRGRGVGTNLVNQLIAESENARKPFRLHVLRGSRAFGWYERLGFRVIQEKEIHLEMERTPTLASA